MIKKIGDLTIKELISMKCPKSSCNSCPFGNYDIDFLSDRLCDLVNRQDELDILDKEIEVDVDDV